MNSKVPQRSPNEGRIERTKPQSPPPPPRKKNDTAVAQLVDTEEDLNNLAVAVASLRHDFQTTTESQNGINRRQNSVNVNQIEVNRQQNSVNVSQSEVNDRQLEVNDRQFEVNQITEARIEALNRCIWILSGSLVILGFAVVVISFK